MTPNYQTIQTPNGRFYHAWTRGVLWDKAAREQAERLLRLDFVKRIAVMADTHKGEGGPVGIAVEFDGALIPAVIGYDIGCGMWCAKLHGLRRSDIDACRPQLRKAIEEAIPTGLTFGPRDLGSWVVGMEPTAVRRIWWDDHNGEEPALADRYDDLVTEYRDIQHWGPSCQLGTLGTGNHFIELSADANDDVYLVIHSGSRGPGARIAQAFQKWAEREMKHWYISLPDDERSLAYLPKHSPGYGAYIDCMKWAQSYAKLSRNLMARSIIEAVLPAVLRKSTWAQDQFDIHHNYLDLSGPNPIARKGAVKVTEGSLAIIPGAMGRRSYIVRGRADTSKSMNTCSHGAGRAMSRTDAERRISVEQHEAALGDLECNRTADTLDETPESYKDIDAVIQAQSDLIEPVAILEARVCVKGKSPKREKRSRK